MPRSQPNTENMETKSQNELIGAMNPQTLDEMMRYRAQLSPTAPLLHYPSSETNYVEYTAGQIEQYIDTAARSYSRRLPRRTSSSECPRIVALLGIANIDYVITMFALYRLGHAVIALSPRLSEEGHTHLIKLFNSYDLIYHRSLSKMANALGDSITELHSHDMITGENYMDPDRDSNDTGLEPTNLDSRVESQNLAVIIHSSGSTGLPKPVELSHATLVMAASKNVDKKAFSCVPFYHGFGLNSFHRGIYSGREIFLYSASVPLTSKLLINTIDKHDFDVFFCVPYALKLLAESDKGVQALRKCGLVWYAGSACPEDLGDYLNQEGIKLVGDYGLSECGPLMTTMRPDGDDAWNYLRPLPHNKPYMRFEERSEGTFELVCLDGMPWKTASNRDDNSYATKDLFEKHPTIQDAYKFVSRQDDTIVLYNGEKVSPATFEGRVRQHPLVAEAIMFGTGQSELGVILVLSDLAKDKSEDEVMEAIWPTIAEALIPMPSYAKVAKSMVVTLTPGTDYPRTDKGTILRQRFYNKFAQIIEDAYIEKNQGSRLDLREEELYSFIRDAVLQVMQVEDGDTTLGDDTDLFSLGVDSLQSTQLRRTFQSRLDLRGKSLPFNVVYENPTLQQLYQFINGMVIGDAGEAPNIECTFETLLNEHSDFQVERSTEKEHYVVLTGATGSLGAHLLVQLVQNPTVKHVYCLVRARSPESASRRVYESLEARRILAALNEVEQAKMTAIPSDLSAPNLAIDVSMYRQLCLRVTDVIHAAWPVNFNMGLTSFKSDIASTKNLIDLCLSPQRAVPATFALCSSISSSMNMPAQKSVPESVPTDPSSALPMGYAQSKLVAENLCIRAAEEAGLRSLIMRIGQIVGDTEHGIWNAKEAVPLMIQSAETIGTLPTMDETHRWLPVDLVARTILEATLGSEAPAGTVMNIINPEGFSWKSSLLPKLHTTGLQFDEVTTSEWLKRLHESEQNETTNPTTKLLPYFDSVYGTDEDKGRGEGREWDTENSSKYSSTFSAGWSITQDIIDKFVRYFEDYCWSQQSSDGERSRQSSWSSETILSTDDHSQRESSNEDDVKAENNANNQQVTKSHAEKLFWDQEKSRFEVQDCHIDTSDLESKVQHQKVHDAHEIDTESLKCQRSVVWSGTGFETRELS